MTPFLQIVSSLREQMQATLSRTDVLRPLAWLVGLLLTALVALSWASAPQWLLATVATLFVPATLLYGAAYVFCLRYDRDGLRSEKYSLHKMAIEHGLIGDSSAGLFESSEAPARRGEEAPPTKQIEHTR